MGPARVLHVVGAMNRGGAETMIMNLYRELNRDNLQFDFLEFKSGDSDYSAEIKKLGGRVLHVNWSQSPLRIHQTIAQIASVIKKEGPFIAVHSHVLFATGTVLIAASRAGVKVRVAHSHNTSDVDQGFIAKMYRWISRKAIKIFATDLVACTRGAGAYLFGKKRFKEDGVVIPNAVSLKDFYPPAGKDKESLHQSLGISSKRLAIISVARMEPAKNHDFLLDVADELEKRGVDFDMILVGDGALREGLEKKTKVKNLTHRVHFWGVREDIADIMRGSDVLLMPSHFEGLPVVLVEAQATGLPCLVSEHVTNEVDMGLGLVAHLPIDSHEIWVDEIEKGLPARPTALDICKQLDARGYTIESSLRKLLSLYP